MFLTCFRAGFSVGWSRRAQSPSEARIDVLRVVQACVGTPTCKNCLVFLRGAPFRTHPVVTRRMGSSPVPPKPANPDGHRTRTLRSGRAPGARPRGPRGDVERTPGARDPIRPSKRRGWTSPICRWGWRGVRPFEPAEGPGQVTAGGRMRRMHRAEPRPPKPSSGICGTPRSLALPPRDWSAGPREARRWPDSSGDGRESRRNISADEVGPRTKPGDGRFDLSVNNRACFRPDLILVESRSDAVADAPFSLPAHRTGRAVFPHPALGQELMPSPTESSEVGHSGG